MTTSAVKMSGRYSRKAFLIFSGSTRTSRAATMARSSQKKVAICFMARATLVLLTPAVLENRSR